MENKLSKILFFFLIIGIVSMKDDEVEFLIETSFEDGDYSMLEPRGDGVKFKIGKDGGKTGDKYLIVNGRNETWHGVNLLIDDLCKPGENYIISAYVRSKQKSQIMLSFQYTDSEGNDHYSNLESTESEGDWSLLKPYKFVMLPNVTNVIIYFESPVADLSFEIDDLSLKAAPPEQIEKDIDSLKNVFKKFFKVGIATGEGELVSKTSVELMKKHFNSLTLGNELKPDFILDRTGCQKKAEKGDQTNPQISLKAAEKVLNFARDNGFSVRGHVLVWHSQTPDWFFKKDYADDGKWLSKSDMLKRMENYIKNVFAAVEEQFPDVDFYAWDVVNEAFLDDGSAREGGEGSGADGKSAWVKVFGDNSFIESAFEYARKYAPKKTKLYYNDYNEYIEGKTNAMIKLAKDLKEKGIIDGLGLQSHLDVGFPSADMYRNALKKFAAIGVDLQITELDVTTKGDDEDSFKTQAKYYGDIFKAIVDYKDSISSVVFWGTTDDHSWRRDNYPLLFNGDFTAKPCFYSVVDTAK